MGVCQGCSPSLDSVCCSGYYYQESSYASSNRIHFAAPMSSYASLPDSAMAVNSGPLILRTYLNGTSTGMGSGGSRDTFLLSPYDIPVSSNRLLATDANGRLTPTDQPQVSSLVVGSTLYGNGATVSTLTASTIVGSTLVVSTLAAGPVTVSSMVVNGAAMWKGTVQTLAANGGTPAIDSTWWGKYNVVTSATAATGYLLAAAPVPVEGTMITVTNTQATYAITVTGTTNLAGGTRTLAQYSTLQLMYHAGISKWISLTNN